MQQTAVKIFIVESKGLANFAHFFSEQRPGDVLGITAPKLPAPWAHKRDTIYLLKRFGIWFVICNYVQS